MTRLFVYGTLMTGFANGVEDIMSRYAEKICDTTYQGKLYLVQGIESGFAYPAVASSEDPADVVYGEVYRLSEPDFVLPIIDRYEGCSDSDPRPHEYRREIVTVYDKNDQPLQAFTYLLTLSEHSFMLIPGGSFSEYMNEMRRSG